MDTKWFAIMVVGMFLAIFGSDAVTEYSRSQCRIEAIKALRDTAQIKQICG